jgi:hypothetical protein
MTIDSNTKISIYKQKHTVVLKSGEIKTYIYNKIYKKKNERKKRTVTGMTYKKIQSLIKSSFDKSEYQLIYDTILELKNSKDN